MKRPLLLVALSWLALAAAPARAAQTVVSLGFDDGSADHVLARQLLDTRGLKGTFYINSAQLGNSGWYMTKADVDAIFANGHEIAGHTLNHLHLSTLSQSQLQTEICNDRTNLVNWGYHPTNFAYPFGEYNSTVRSVVIGCGYSTARTVGGGTESIPPRDAWVLASPPSVKVNDTLATMQMYVTNAENAGGGWVNMVFHHICDGSGCDTYSVSSSNLGAFLDWLKARAGQGTVVKTVAQVMGAAPPSPASPSISSLSPSSAPAGGPAFTLTINGSNFVNGSLALWNGASRATTFVSASQLRAAIPASDISMPGTRSVSISNSGTTSNTASFAVSSSTGSPAPPPPGGALLSESFSYANGLITNEYAHYNPTNPSAVVSSTWDLTSGSLFADGGMGWTGVPDSGVPDATSSNFNDSTFFRAVTKRTDFNNVSLYVSLINQGFVSSTASPAQSWDGIHVALRYQSATTFYTLSVNRRDNKAVLKKRRSGTETTLASSNYTPSLNSLQKVQADANTQADGSVALKLTANGATLLSFVDPAAAALRGPGAVGVFAENANFRFDDLAVMPFGVAPSTAPAPAPNPAPTVASLSPSSGTAGSPAFTLGVIGAGFISSSTVLWRGLARPTAFLSPTRLNAAIAAADVAAAGTAAVAVFTSTPGGGTSSTQTFTINAAPMPPNPAPALSALSPSSATAGGPGFTLTLTGSGFINESTVLWNGAARATAFLSSTQVTAAISSFDIGAPGAASVSVVTSTPGGGTSSTQTFTIGAPPASGALFAEDFNRPNGLITNEYAHWSPTAAGAVVSSTWAVSAGSLFVDSNAAWTGVPDTRDPNAGSTNGTGSATFRAATKRGGFGDVTVSFRLATVGFVSGSANPAQNWDGVHLALRYLNENSFYDLQLNRRDNKAVLQKKSGSTWTTLTSAAYAVPLNAAQIVSASAVNNSNGSVTVTLKINGTQILSASDSSSPLTAAGSLGLRADNANFRFDDLLVRSASAPGPAGLAAATSPGTNSTLSTLSTTQAAPTAAANLDAVRVYPNPWRADIDGGVDVTIDGLPPQSEVRFYTVSGQWVRTISAATGTGTWNLLNGEGSRVSSGIYMYLIIDESGRRSHGVLGVIR